jgi:hypothetical protein
MPLMAVTATCQLLLLLLPSSSRGQHNRKQLRVAAPLQITNFQLGRAAIAAAAVAAAAAVGGSRYLEAAMLQPIALVQEDMLHPAAPVSTAAACGGGGAAAAASSCRCCGTTVIPTAGTCCRCCCHCCCFVLMWRRLQGLPLTVDPSSDIPSSSTSGNTPAAATTSTATAARWDGSSSIHMPAIGLPGYCCSQSWCCLAVGVQLAVLSVPDVQLMEAVG